MLNWQKKKTYRTSKMLYKKLLVAWDRSLPCAVSAARVNTSPQPKRLMSSALTTSHLAIPHCPFDGPADVTKWISSYWLARPAPATFSGSIVAQHLAEALPVGPVDVQVDRDVASVSTPLSHSIARYEAASLLKSVRVLAQALGTSVQEAVLAMTTVDTKPGDSSLMAAHVLRRHASSPTARFLDYALNRRVGFVSSYSWYVAHTVVDLAHAAVADMLVSCAFTDHTMKDSALVRLDADAAHHLMLSIKPSLANLMKLAY